MFCTVFCTCNLNIGGFLKMYLCYSLSNSITQKEWEKVYKETLVLADKLNLADWDKFYYKGIRSYSYCKVKEQTDKEYGKLRHYWLACGEYNYMGDGEYFRLEREIDIKEYDENAGPAILAKIESYTNINSKDFENQTDTRYLRTWRGTYFVRLLAILCFMESKLHEKIFIYGDFDKKSCENAVKLVNKHLKKPIELPARCNLNKLYEIVKTIDIPEEEKLNLIKNAYLGETSWLFSKFIKEKFDKKIIHKFWKNEFKGCIIGCQEFKEVLEEYLSCGFDFKYLFSYIKFTNTKEECIKILETIIDIENNMNKISKFIGITRNPKDNNVIGFSQDFRYSLFAAEDISKVETCTFDNYVSELSKYFGEQVDVKSFLKEKIKDEDEDSLFKRVKKYLREDNYYLFKGEEKYDIVFSTDLMYFKPGKKIAPYIMKDIKAAVKANKKRLSDKEFKELQEKEPTEQIYELIDIKKQFPARDIDWIHAIDYFNSHSDALERYYPLFHMKFDYFSSSEDIAKALFMNDAFYEYCKKLGCSK